MGEENKTDFVFLLRRRSWDTHATTATLSEAECEGRTREREIDKLFYSFASPRESPQHYSSRLLSGIVGNVSCLLMRLLRRFFRGLSSFGLGNTDTSTEAHLVGGVVSRHVVIHHLVHVVVHILALSKKRKDEEYGGMGMSAGCIYI